jgi:hypothetical protein
MNHNLGILAVLSSVLLSTAVLLTPTFQVASAQGESNMTNLTTSAETSPKAIISITPEHESPQEIRDEIRSNHPLLAAVADKIETMDAQETLKYTIGVEIVSDLLKLHALELVVNQTGGK